MRSLNKHGRLILLLILSVGIVPWPVWSLSETPRDRVNPEALEKELQVLLSAGMAQSHDPEDLRHLASLYLDLGYGLYVKQEKKLASFQEGARLAQKSLEFDESSADGHFLYAANLGSATELQGVMFGALTIQELKFHVLRTLELDAGFAPAHHMLGRMYEELPWFLGGDQDAAGKHLKMAVSLDQAYVPGHLDLGRWLLKQGFEQEAVQEFRQVVETPPLEKIWIWERIHRPQAINLLLELKGFDKKDGPDP